MFKDNARYPVMRSDADWRRLLQPAAYKVMRQQGTELPWTSPLNKEHRAGLFLCAGCAWPLYSSEAKFESGTGWPSFFQPLSPRSVKTRTDTSLFFIPRTEVHCANCGGHLGHVFPDGPRPTGQRYCMNGVALRFRPGRTRV
jgi:peptide-methionine (R)-S-oxide reductase